MEIIVHAFIPNKANCYGDGRFKACQYMQRRFREKTSSKYFYCSLFLRYLVPISREKEPIKPCHPCMNARHKDKS